MQKYDYWAFLRLSSFLPFLGLHKLPQGHTAHRHTSTFWLFEFHEIVPVLPCSALHLLPLLLSTSLALSSASSPSFSSSPSSSSSSLCRASIPLLLSQVQSLAVIKLNICLPHELLHSQGWECHKSHLLRPLPCCLNGFLNVVASCDNGLWVAISTDKKFSRLLGKSVLSFPFSLESKGKNDIESHASSPLRDTYFD